MTIPHLAAARKNEAFTRRLSLTRQIAIALLAAATVVAPQPVLAEAPTASTMSAENQAPLEASGYLGREVMVPMRDDIRLHAWVWRPSEQRGPLPILITRGPYGFGTDKMKAILAGQYKDLVDSGYILVFQDIRGRFGSEGQFVMLRPRATEPEGVDESTDAYDSVEWLIRNLPDNNGRAGMFGVSYAGWTSALATVNPHPALKAVSVQASPDDMFIGDDFHHNGAFRLDYAWEYTAALETDGRTLNKFSFGKDDPYGWFLKQKSLASLDRNHLGRTLPTWQNFVRHPTYDQYWKAVVTSKMMDSKVSVPNLNVVGWYDQEDFYGPLKIYANQEKGDDKNRNFLVIGPWNHGGWNNGPGESADSEVIAPTIPRNSRPGFRADPAHRSD